MARRRRYNTDGEYWDPQDPVPSLGKTFEEVIKEIQEEFTERFHDEVEGLAGAVDKTHVHTQSTARQVWLIEHDLDKYPSVSVSDHYGREVEVQVLYISKSRVEITLSHATTSTAFLN